MNLLKTTRTGTTIVLLEDSPHDDKAEDTIPTIVGNFNSIHNKSRVDVCIARHESGWLIYSRNAGFFLTHRKKILEIRDDENEKNESKNSKRKETDDGFMEIAEPVADLEDEELNRAASAFSSFSPFHDSDAAVSMPASEPTKPAKTPCLKYIIQCRSCLKYIQASGKGDVSVRSRTILNKKLTILNASSTATISLPCVTLQEAKVRVTKSGRVSFGKSKINVMNIAVDKEGEVGNFVLLKRAEIENRGKGQIHGMQRPEVDLFLAYPAVSNVRIGVLQ